MGNPFAVDRTFVISLKALREVLKGISTDRERWWIAETKQRSVVIGYRASDEVNTISFEFPKIADVPLFKDGDGEIVCLYPISREAVQRGLYWDNNHLLNDEVRDWQTFWPPIRHSVTRYYSTSGRSMSKTSGISSSSPRRRTT